MKLFLLCLLLIAPMMANAYQQGSNFFYFMPYDYESSEESEQSIEVYDYTEKKDDPNSDCLVVETGSNYEICYTIDSERITTFNDI